MISNFNGYFWLIVIALLFQIGLTLFVLHKVRRIYLASYAIREDAAIARRESESLFAQIQALLALERKLNLAEALPPLRGWAGSPDFLLEIANEVLDNKPLTIMECSSGVSTLVIARCLQLNGVGHVYSLEHERVFARKTRDLLGKHALAAWATVLDAPLQTVTTGTPWYEECAIPSDLPLIDMLVIDGPPASIANLARAPAVPRLLPRLSKRVVVVIDDADRNDELEIVEQWRKLLPHLNAEHIACEKGLVIFRPTPKTTQC
ncbi:class I SAM-dependent methyltransferase [Candidatus Accumulibacter phosphatis]|uniref:class I SAM-dependent methyltransferase n=1 Tax=Candidatus Accumulibacter phosphatis TaxID=327160 RepID=UPI00110A91E2|nr:class I SAM-dependent methyltransferase [Candidatus Accumulibacter phosphatis]